MNQSVQWKCHKGFEKCSSMRTSGWCGARRDEQMSHLKTGDMFLKLKCICEQLLWRVEH